jgi:hypothetical protein
MGGGEGVGSLSNIVEALYMELVSQGIDALLLVCCGRNEKLKNQMDDRDWTEVFKRWTSIKDRQGMAGTGILSLGSTCADPLLAAGCMESGSVSKSIRRMLSRGNLQTAMTMPPPENVSETKVDSDVLPHSEETKASDSSTCPLSKTPGKVHVMGLGFITQMAEMMVAADVLVSKAGPGTISEAAALSLPVMLTSYLPGQEEGNVDYVIDGGFGAYVHDSDPLGVADEVCMWLTDDLKRTMLSRAARAKGAPYAARDIVKQIGQSTLRWKEANAALDFVAAHEKLQRENSL